MYYCRYIYTEVTVHKKETLGKKRENKHKHLQ